jgi:hypothetical protein
MESCPAIGMVIDPSLWFEAALGSESHCTQVKMPRVETPSLKIQPAKAEATMVKSPPPLDPRHERSQFLLRFLGLLVLGVGVLFSAVGLISFFAAFGTFQPPRYFWAVFVGFPLIAIGAAMTRLGYLGRFYRYVFGEVTPVARDTFNTMAEGTQSGVETVAQALGRGLTSGMGGNILPEPGTIRCRRCAAANPPHARFCNQCGTALASGICTACGAAMIPGARFCNHCGQPIA